MKVQQLVIKNIGIIKDETIKLDKPLILFYGQIKAGKTTILNAVKWLFGGSFPSDIIRHGEIEASVTLEFDNGSITRGWYVAKGESTKARPIVFILNGKLVKNPVDEIKKFLNPYLLDNEYLKKMSESERKAYFAQLFSVDTAELDIQYDDAERKAKELRATLKGYGEIDITPVEIVDVEPLRTKLNAAKTAYRSELEKLDNQNDKIRSANRERDESLVRVGEIDTEIADLNKRIEAARLLIEENEQHKKRLAAWLQNHPSQDILARPLPPDTSDIETQIADASANAVHFDQYQANLKRAEARDADQAKLSGLEKSLREIKKTKITKLKDISATCGIKGLSFDENGNFVYDGTQAGMLSTSQLMQLSEELAALYPKGFGLELIDRAESLGKSIFGFIAYAEKEEKTILAAIVSDRPAEVPENVGVFVVEDGSIHE